MEPPVHIVAGEEKWFLCLSRVAKWIAGIAATVVGALLIGAMGFAWQSNQTLGRVLERLDAIDHRFDRTNQRIEKLSDKLDRKVDK